MQDRFRFRTWYTDYDGTQEMLYDTQATYDFMRGTYHHGDFQEVLDDKNCINMQCTGLKDKTGKLIYEGDIISDGIDNTVVEWSNEDCQFFNVETDPRGFKIYSTFGELLSIEVIGNRYENKELLESEG